MRSPGGPRPVTSNPAHPSYLPELTVQQQALATMPSPAHIFLEGPAGTGKTTTAVQRLLHLLQQGLPASSILVLVPQRTLGSPYAAALRNPKLRPGGAATLVTAGGLARRMVELFWPMVAEEAGFARPDEPPTFLTLETAQYHMARLVQPLLDKEHLFDSVSLDRNRLYSQIIDNLNKAAVVGFPHTEIGQRLMAAWTGDPAHLRVYEDAQRCATAFRSYCLAHNLLDFSLQVEVFRDHLWTNGHGRRWPGDASLAAEGLQRQSTATATRASSACRSYLMQSYRCLIADNLEEDTPFAHDLLRDWLPQLDNALLVYDHDGGYRQFLGADPRSAVALRPLCEQQAAFTKSFVTPPALQALGSYLGYILDQDKRPPEAPESSVATTDSGGADQGRRAQRIDQAIASQDVRTALAYEEGHRYYPQMLDWVADEIASLAAMGVAPGEIVVLAPYLSDALRFSLMNRLASREVPARSHRPSRALRDEPATQCLLTLAALAHPQWGKRPTRFDFTYALLLAVDALDLVRAQLLAEIVYRRPSPAGGSEDGPILTSFEQINPEMHERITYVLGGRYDTLRLWLADYRARQQETPLDHFLSRLFGEILSQPGFGFHNNIDAAEVAANLIESVQKFRRGTAGLRTPEDKPLGQEYLDMVDDGVIAAQYVRSWRVDRRQSDDAVLLAPAYTFLMTNRPADYQFWLDVGSRGWSERLLQPLTQPYVLSRLWNLGQVWTDSDEFATSQERLHRLVLGLLRRCRRQVYLGLSELSEQGYEQRGPLLWTINQVLRYLPINATGFHA